jgi:hypothetical protein
MSTHLTITSGMLLVVLLCTLHLLLGVWMGSVIKGGKWQFAAQTTSPLVTRACAELQARLCETTAVSDQANRLFLACTQHVPALPPEIISATNRLAKATAVLRGGIESVSQLFAPRAPNDRGKFSTSLQESASPHRIRPSRRLRRKQTGTKHPGEQTCGEQPFSISNEDFNNMADIMKGSDSDSHIDRYRYDVFQYIAPFSGDLPGAESFKKVRCRDLSRGGFSYLVEDSPDYESLVVVLGNPPDLTFLVAHVEHHQPTIIDGQTGRLVGCRFVQQVKEIYAWDAIHDEITILAPAEAANAS